MVRADSARTVWSREILLVKADPVDRAPAAHVAVQLAPGREAEDRAARVPLVDPAAEAATLAESLAAVVECLEVVEAAVAGAED
jgi:hypothetical protein